MRKRKRKIVKLSETIPEKNNLLEQIKKASEGLYYISETDAEITPFAGSVAESVSKEEILRQTKNAFDTPIEERNFAEIFKRLTKIQDWYGEEETAAVAKFVVLKELLEKNLRDLKVFRIGETELDIYVVGLDAEDNLLGIETKAVET